MPVEVVSPVLVGREPELAQLRSALARTVAGEPGVVLVGGEAGVGKSRLLDGRVRSPAPRCRVLTGGCIELGGEGLPLVPLVEALRTLVRTTPDDDLDRFLGPARRELARLLPELARRRRRARRRRPAARRSCSSSSWGCSAGSAQDRPLVLVVEDLHWADRSTLDLVAFLVRALQGTRVLLVLTYRSDEVDRRSPAAPAARRAGSGCAASSASQLERFSRGRGRRPSWRRSSARRRTRPMVDLVFDRSEGNAFFVEELVRTVRDGAQETRSPAVPARRPAVAGRAAVRTRPAAAAHRRRRRAAGCPSGCSPRSPRSSPAELYEALREAVDASLLLVDGTGRGYAFRHALTRDARLRRPAARRARASCTPPTPRRSTRDPALAGDDAVGRRRRSPSTGTPRTTCRAPWPRRCEAGRQAMAAFAPAEARRHLERALEVWRSVPDAESRAGADQVEVLRLAARRDVPRRRPGARAHAAATGARPTRPPTRDPERAACSSSSGRTCARSATTAAASTSSRRRWPRLPEEPPDPGAGRACWRRWPTR